MQQDSPHLGGELCCETGRGPLRTLQHHGLSMNSLGPFVSASAGTIAGVLSIFRKRSSSSGSSAVGRGRIFFALPALCRGWLSLLIAVAFVTARGQEPAKASSAVPVDQFSFRYGLEHPQLPSIEELGRIQIRLTHAAQVWRAPVGAGGEILQLNTVPAGSLFEGDALRSVAQEIVNWFNARGIYGVWVTFADLETRGNELTDTRPTGDRTARVVVWASQVAETRTLARGLRFKPRDSVNNPKHHWILADSPLQPASGPDGRGDLFRQDVLERYLSDLSSQAGRRVEASIASAGLPGKVVLDYLVTEIKPWVVFTQASNTGTAATDKWRGRLGFQHNQLTNHDDVLNIDAIATPDIKTYGTFASYRIPILRPSRLVMRVYASYGDFLASDTTLQSLRFGGKNWMGGLEFDQRSLLARRWELITSAGANFTHYEIQSEANGQTLNKNSAEFFIPFLSSTLSRDSDTWSVGGGLRLENGMKSGSGRDSTSGVTLGRIGAETTWTALRWNLGGTLYLERLWEPVEKNSTLAHELSFRARGRWLVRGHRLIPQEEEPLGGALTVRGYPEAVLSADEFALATAEYAFHVPRALKPGERGRLWGRPFSWRPPQPGQRADWDLVLRGFFDYGYRSVAKSPAPGGSVSGPTALSDRNVSFAGAGAGFEFVLWRNFSLRCDLGTALTELRDDSQPAGKQVVVRSGSVRAHIVSSLSW